MADPQHSQEAKTSRLQHTKGSVSPQGRTSSYSAHASPGAKTLCPADQEKLSRSL